MKRGILLGIIAGLILLFGGTALALYLSPSNTEEEQSATSTATTTEEITQYKNETLGLSFSYPSEWEMTREKAIDSGLLGIENVPDTYWILLENGKYEIAFEIGTPQGASFVLPEEHLNYYEKMTTASGLKILRSKLEYLDTTYQGFAGIPENGPYWIQAIFPELNQINNVGDTFHGAENFYRSETLGVRITYGMREKTRSEVSVPMLNEMDAIIETVRFEEPEVAEVFARESEETQTENWKTYTNKAIGFTFNYPSSYTDFVGNRVWGYEAESTEVALLNGMYSSYPELSITISRISEYKYTKMYTPFTYQYDPSAGSFTSSNGDTGETKPHPYDISLNDWKGIRTSFGDAGAFSYGYAIPYEPENVIVEITASGYVDDYRPIDFKAILETLTFEK